MEENKIGTYLLYAIGEILVVVIGILIALQINNWNEERKDRKAELIALIDLKEEFETNHENFLWGNGHQRISANYPTIRSCLNLAF